VEVAVQERISGPFPVHGSTPRALTQKIGFLAPGVHGEVVKPKFREFLATRAFPVGLFPGKKGHPRAEPEKGSPTQRTFLEMAEPAPADIFGVLKAYPSAGGDQRVPRGITFNLKGIRALKHRYSPNRPSHFAGLFPG
jgi:hypothetical protein